MDFIYFFLAHCPHLVKERSEIKKGEFGRRVRGVVGGGGLPMLFPEDNISFEGPAERKAEGAEVALVECLEREQGQS